MFVLLRTKAMTHLRPSMVPDDGDREEGKKHKDLGVRFSGKPVDLGFSGESVPLGLSQKW